MIYQQNASYCKQENYLFAYTKFGQKKRGVL